MLAQVGINTTEPTAELEVATTSTGIPALRLEPQVNPTGSEEGQIAIIGDTSYLYDNTRSKWLGFGLTGLQFNQNSGRDGGTIRYGGNQESSAAGPLMPFDGTIVYLTAKVSSGNGNQSQTFTVNINGVAGPTITLSSGQQTRIDVDTDVSAGDYITLTSSVGSGSNTEASVIVWIKRRP